jgi:TonB family protein
MRKAAATIMDTNMISRRGKDLLYLFVFFAIATFGIAAQMAPTPAPAVQTRPLTIPPGANLNDPQVLLSYAASINGLEVADDDAVTGAPKLTPWYLKAAYETFDDAGNALGSGVFEEWHVSSDQWNRRYAGTRFTQTEYKTAAGHFYQTDAGGAPWPDSLIEQELVHPMPAKRDTEETVPGLHDRAFGKLKLNCIMFSQQDVRPGHSTQWPLGLFPTYCFEKDTARLRFGLFDGSIGATFNKMAIFEGRYIAKEVELTDDARTLLRIHIQTLRSMPASEAAAMMPPATAKSADLKNVSVASGIMTGNKLRGAEVRYPQEAKQNHIEGKVVLKAMIGTDGRIHQLRVVSSPDPTLSISSLAAVERWVYKPYTLNGAPVNVETTINVVYKLGPF